MQISNVVTLITVAARQVRKSSHRAFVNHPAEIQLVENPIAAA